MEGLKYLLIASKTGIPYFTHAFDETLQNLNPDLLTGFINAILMFSKESLQDDLQTIIFAKIRITFKIFEELLIVFVISHNANSDILPSIMDQLRVRFLALYGLELENPRLNFEIFLKFTDNALEIIGSDRYRLQPHKGTVELYKPEADFINLVGKMGGRPLHLVEEAEFHQEENAYTVQNGHVIKLSLYKRGLVAIPDAIGNLLQLKQLIISRNNLTFIPERIGDLQSLKELIVDNNGLINLSEKIGTLIELEILDIGWNKITEIPNAIENLTHLKTIKMPWNRFTTFPLFLLKMPNLEFIDLSFNKITEIPSFSLFNNLSHINLEGNQISIIQSSNSSHSLKNIKYLNLKGNRLFEVPKEVVHMDNLQVLNLEGNRIQVLPVELCNLLNLKELSIQGNPLSEIDQKVRSWIRDLEAWGCKVYREGLERF